MSAKRLFAGPGLAALDDEGIVYLASLPRGPIAVLDGTAAVIWRHAIGHSRAEVVERLADKWGCDRAAIQRDIDEFIDDLLERDLLSERNGGEPPS